MKLTRKISLLFVAALLFSSMLLGCAATPVEYTDGVKLDRDYPEDDMPIIDESVIYYCEEDEDAITIKFGTQDDLDDVADFYKDFFQDNEIVLDYEKDKSTKYLAKGFYKDLYFEIIASDPSGEYEEKLFITTVKIEIEFGEVPIPTDPSLQEKLIGFWHFQAGSSMSKNSAVHFLEDGTAIIYNTSLDSDIAVWEVIDEETVTLTFQNGTRQIVKIDFDYNEVDHMQWRVWSTTSKFYRDTSTQILDQELTKALGDKTWQLVHYAYDTGIISSHYSASYVFNSDGTFEDLFSEPGAGTWYISNGYLFCNYGDERYMIRPIELEHLGSIGIFYLLDTSSSEYWLFIDAATDFSPAPEFADIKWYAYSNIYPDNDLSLKYEGFVEFSSDYSMSIYNLGEKSAANGTWYYENDKVYGFFIDGAKMWNIEVGTSQENTKCLSLTDSNGNDEWEGCILTDISKINYVSDSENMTALLTTGTWISQFYVNSNGTTKTLPETTITFDSNGTFLQNQKSEPVAGTWNYKDGILHMEYPSLGEDHDYPDTYIKTGSAEGAIILIIGDDDSSGEGGYYKYVLYIG